MSFIAKKPIAAAADDSLSASSVGASMLYPYAISVLTVSVAVCL